MSAISNAPIFQSLGKMFPGLAGSGDQSKGPIMALIQKLIPGFGGGGNAPITSKRVGPGGGSLVNRPTVTPPPSGGGGAGGGGITIPRVGGGTSQASTSLLGR